MKLTNLLEQTVTSKDMLTVQQAVVDDLHDDSWEISLSKGALTMKKGDVKVTFNFESRTITSAQPKLVYEVDFADHPEAALLSVAALLDLKHELVKSLKGYKYSFIINDGDGTILLIAEKRIHPSTFEVRFEFEYDGEWIANHADKSGDRTASFTSLEDTMVWVEEWEG
jgi:hypothetical protein